MAAEATSEKSTGGLHTTPQSIHLIVDSSKDKDAIDVSPDVAIEDVSSLLLWREKGREHRVSGEVRR